MNSRIKTGSFAIRKISFGYYYFCAISSTSCEDPERFLTYQEVDSNEDKNKPCYLYPEPYEPSMIFTMHNNTINHQDTTTEFKQISDDECEKKYKSSISCKAYQIGKKTKKDEFKEKNAMK